MPVTARPSTRNCPLSISSPCSLAMKWLAANRRSSPCACAVPPATTPRPSISSTSSASRSSTAPSCKIWPPAATSPNAPPSSSSVISASAKSHLAQALGHAPSVRASTFSSPAARAAASLNAARAAGCYERKLATLARVPLLIIDDFGLKPLRPPADEDFHELIAERYEQATTIVTSNLDFREWGDAFPNNRLLAPPPSIGCATTPIAWTLEDNPVEIPRSAPPATNRPCKSPQIG